MRVLIGILICILGCQGVKTQMAEEIYDLRFRTINSKSSPWGGSNVRYCQSKIDSSILINGMHPLKCSSIRLYPMWDIYMPFYCKLAQQIFIPEEFDEVEFVLNSKCSNIINAKLKVRRFDKSESFLSVDSVTINPTGDWSECRLKVDGKGVNLFYVEIIAKLNEDLKNKHDSTSYYFDRLKIFVDGKNINSIDFSSCILKSNTFPEYSPWQDGLSDKFSDKKILGLAETIHGDSLINRMELEMVKHQVKSEKCKFIVHELPSDLVLFWNLYIHGHESVKLEKLLEESTTILFNSEVLSDLLIFLKKYNETAVQKIYIAGMDRNNHTYEKNLARFLNSVFENNPHLFLDTVSKLLSEKQLNEALHLLETKIDLTDVLDPTISALFFQSLKQEIEYPNNLSILFYFLKDRDKIMSSHLFGIIDSLLPPNKQVVVIGHWKHLNKIADVKRMQKSCGNFLVGRYGDEYGVIGIHKGRGSFIGSHGSKMKRFFVDIPESPLVLENYGNESLDNKTLYFLTTPLEYPVWIRWSGAVGDKNAIESVILEERVDAFLWME